jgi:hypothetical protein
MIKMVNCRYLTFLRFITFVWARALFNDEQDPPPINHKDLSKKATDYAAQFTYQRALSPRQINKSKFLLVQVAKDSATE